MTSSTLRCMFSLAYISTTTTEMSDAALVRLLDGSRAANRAAEVTGFLLYRDGRFLQYLEGPEAAVRDLMRSIGSDARHRHVAVLLESAIARRQFPDWTMGFNASRSSLVAFVPGYMATSDTPTMTSGTALALTELILWFREQPERSTPREKTQPVPSEEAATSM
jgi:hypothetical protein